MVVNFELTCRVVFIFLLYFVISTRREQEELASPTESGPASGAHDTIPLFTDWLKSWKHCEAKRFENGVPWTDEQFKLVRDPTAYSAFCKSDIFGSWEPSDRVYTGSHQKNLRANRITNEESQEKYAQLFKSLMTREREADFNNTATPKITSFPATCVHVADADNKPAPCFDKTRTRGIKTEKIFGDPFQKDNDLKYIKYPANCADQNSFHSSYKTLLTILADRIEMKPMDLQAKVNKLENALLFGQSLLYGVL